MAKLKITKNHQILQEINLDPAQTYLAGRAESCQIKLDAEPGVSRQHFQLTFQNDKWNLEVISKYGELYINNEKTPSSFSLEDGQKFTVPPYEFEFGNGAIQNEISSQSQNNVSNSESLDKTSIAVMPSAAYLKLVDNKGSVRQLFRLEGEAWLAGRDVTCSIFIDNPRVSRKQFEIYREEQRYFIRDLGSANGTIVNGHQISSTEWTQLNSSDVITVIDWVLHFEIHDSEYKQRVEQSKNVVSEDPVVPQSNSEYNDDFLPTNYVPIPDFESEAQQQYQQQNSYFPVPSYDQQQPPGSGYGGPFSGNADGQFQSPRPSANVHSSSGWSDLSDLKSKINPIRALILVIILGAIIFGVMTSSFDDKTGSTDKNKKTKDIFESLSAEDQQYVLQTYGAAEQYMNQQLFQNAIDEIVKLETKISTYKSSKKIKENAQLNLAAVNSQIENEKNERQKAELEEKIQKQVSDCGSTIDPKTVTVGSIENCLSSVISLNPEHPQILALKKRVEQIANERESQRAKDTDQKEQGLKLQNLYSKAESLLRAEKPKEAIFVFEQVVSSPLHDSLGLKIKSKNKIQVIRNKIESDQKTFLEKADKLLKENKNRDAVIYLLKASKLNPDSNTIKVKLNSAMTELRRQMQAIFQDAILEESVGEVDSAKVKWKKIMDQSVPSEEYYEKARLKLRKYGVL